MTQSDFEVTLCHFEVTLKSLNVTFQKSLHVTSCHFESLFIFRQANTFRFGGMNDISFNLCMFHQMIKFDTPTNKNYPKMQTDYSIFVWIHFE